MKSNIRSRKIILQSLKNQQAQGHSTPNKLPPARFVLRANKKEQDQSHKIPSNKVVQESEKGSRQRENFINTDFKKQIREDDQFIHPDQFLEARDRRTIVKYDFREKKFQLDAQKQKLNEWLGEMHFKIVSSSFNLYLAEQLTFEQVKVHCCQNLLLNILNFLENLSENNDNQGHSSLFERQKLSYVQMTDILRHINDILVKNLAYMQIKYPLTKDSKPNKALQSLITKTNNLGNDEHDIIMKSKVQFKFKQQGNYTAQIMKFINFLITKQTQLCGIKGNNKKQLTYFQFFYQTMQRIFTSIYKPDFDKKQKQNQLQDPIHVFAKIMSQGVIEGQGITQVKTKQQKEYKQKVMKYTHYLIGQKVSTNTELYTDKQIQTQIFDVKNSSILRILTKWTQQLQRKILNAQQQILKRPFRFKRNTQSQFSKLNANQKNDLYQQANRRAKQVIAFNQQLKQNYNQIESMLSCHLKPSQDHKNIPKNQYKVGYFCSKIQAAASSTLLSYLNKIIHILLLIPEQLKKLHEHDEQYIENMNINLITFKISDLFRCKIKSRQAQIIRIFKQIKGISEKGQPFKIVRIKDRLSQGTRDIMVNILFKGIFLCEIQLAIQQYVQNKQRSYDSFSHFLYQMHRSRLGPIMQSACTWSQFDQRVKIFREINDNPSNFVKLNMNHHCNKQFFIYNQYPFVCTICQKFYSSQLGLISHKKCVLCKSYFECSVCIYNRMSQQQISKLLNLDTILGKFKKYFKLWNFYEQQQNHRKLPLFGLIISKKMKKPQIIFFQTIIFKYDAYIIQIKQNQNEQNSSQIIVIQKILGNSQKIIRNIFQKYIIYQWIQQKAINKRIMPDNMRYMLEQENRKKIQLARQKKAQKQRNKIRLQKRRKQQQQKMASFFKRGYDNKNQQQSKQQQQKKQQKKQQKQQSSSQKQYKIQQRVQPQKTTKYNENICKINEILQVRIIQRQQQEGVVQVLILGIFLKQYTIRNKLKKLNNKNILHKLINRKIEVLFMQDQFIHDEINDIDSLTQIQLQQLKQTFQDISQIYFDNNYIQSIRFIQSITNLKVAHFSHNSICDLTPLQELKQITQLVLQNNEIVYLDGLRNKNQLIQLNLNRNQIPQLQFFNTLQQGQMSKLKHLYLNDNNISNMNGLQKLTGLVKLDLSFNDITQIAYITTLNNLQQLDLSANCITKMKGVGNFPNLKKLFLNNNCLIMISKEITVFHQLAVLNLASNKIKKIKHLSNGNFSKTLKILNLASNKIDKMEGLDNLESLQQLYLEQNQIQSISGYLDLVNLRVLNLSSNCIQELDFQDVQKDLPCLKTLDLSSNILNNTESNKSNLAYLSKLFGNITVRFKKQF